MHPSHTENKGKKRDDNDEDAEPPRRRTRLAKPLIASESSTKYKGKKREHEEAPSTRQRPVTRSLRARESESSKIASSADIAKNKGKKRKQPDDDLDYEPKDGPHDSAKKLLQQAWAQAVQADGTLIVLHSGNYELVCVRHRGSQTLYVSDLIEPHNFNGYGKLHVGIFIAAIQETMDRKKLQKLKLSGDGDNPTGGEDDNQKDHNGGSGSHHDGGGKHHEGRRGGGEGGRRGRSERGRRGSRSQGSARTLRSTDELVVVRWLEKCQSYDEADEQ